MKKGSRHFSIAADPERVLGEPIPTPEQALWVEVVRLAIAEACGVVPTAKVRRPHFTAQARAYIQTADFLHACELAGFDGLALRPRVLEMMAGDGARAFKQYSRDREPAEKRAGARGEPPHPTTATHATDCHHTA